MAPQTQEFGRYRLVKSLGAGGMAEVFLAKLEGVEGFERKLAIKRILPHHSKNEGFVEMFKDEARLVSRLSHPNIVQTFEFGKVGDCYYLSMEYVEGVSLADIMTYHKRRKTRVPVPALVEIGIQICRGINYAHRETDDNGEPLGIIHRDLTPHNILVSRKGIVKITDFGIAKASMNTHLTQAGMIKGKVPYMSPEQAMGLKLTHVSDIFSVGIVLYEMCCLERLFHGDNDFVTLQRVQEAVIPSIKEKRPDIPDRLETAILKALARDRTQRYQWASELEADLTRIKFELGEAFQTFDLAAFVETIYQGREARHARGQQPRTAPPRPAGGEEAQVEKGLSEIAAGLSKLENGLEIVAGPNAESEDEEQKTVLISTERPQPKTQPPPNGGLTSQPTLEKQVPEPSEKPSVPDALPTKRTRRVVAILAVLVLGIVGAGGYWAWSSSRGSVVVEVNPADAEVYFNGVKAPGQSPYSVTGLKSGEVVKIAASKAGYVPFERTLTIKGGVRQRLPIRLAHETRSLELNTIPAGATVYLGGHKTGWRTPCRLELAPGIDYTLAFVKEGYETHEQAIRVEELEEGTITVEMKPGVSSPPAVGKEN